MADPFDKAQQLDELYRQMALANRPRPLAEAPDEDEQGRYCLDCGVRISPQRLAIQPHAVRCTECQSYKEPHR